MPKQTPLYSTHVELKAKIVDFAGWEMPIQYSGIINEHQAVRKNAGLFDVGHMGVFKISGPQALEFIQKVTVNDASKLNINQIQYSIVCNERGGVVDDILVYRLADHYLLVVNASNTEKVKKWFLQQNLKKSKIEDLAGQKTMLALQGPKAQTILEKACEEKLSTLKHFWVTEAAVGGVPALISRTGYTGEDGFELALSPQTVHAAWEILLKLGQNEGLLPCGLGARDTLRLEAALPLYGHEYDEETTPLEAGFGWVVKFAKGEFIGRNALLKQKEAGLKKRLIGLELGEKAIPRQGYAVHNLETKKQVGKVTSGTFSPTLGKPIALAYVESEGKYLAVDPVGVEIRGKEYQAKIVALPFYRRSLSRQ